MNSQKKKGKCETCGKPDRLLQCLASGQLICRTCLKEIRPPRDETHGAISVIRRLQAAGIKIDDYASKEETERLRSIKELRDCGVTITEDSTTEQIEAASLLVTVEWYDKIAGVSYHQGAVSHLHPGDQLFPIRKSENRYDHGAIKLFTKDGKHIGWIREETNGSLAHDIDQGIYHEIFVKNITGLDHPTHGVNIRIVKYPYRKDPSSFKGAFQTHEKNVAVRPTPITLASKLNARALVSCTRFSIRLLWRLTGMSIRYAKLFCKWCASHVKD
ncbi:MAG: hypothetical protein HKL96_08140 [Phycisphaerales bacterium]|nr:hypothetical protein [Phycisphaerales bacterium]